MKTSFHTLTVLMLIIAASAFGHSARNLSTGIIGDPVDVDGDDAEWIVEPPAPEATDWDWQTDLSDIHSSKIAYIDVLYVLALNAPAGAEIELERQNELANQIFINSKVHIRLRPAGFVRAGIVESDGVNADNALHTKIATNSEGLATLRYTSGADMVVGLYLSGPRFCGAGGGGGRLGSIAEAAGFMQATLALLCLREGRTLAHEVGHNLGLAHSRKQIPYIGDVFPFALGHGVQGKIATVMAYPEVFGLLEGSHFVFSNPNLRCDDLPCGVSEKGNPSDSANAALALNLVRFQAEKMHAAGRPEIMIENAIAAIDDAGLRSCIENYQQTANRTFAGEVLDLDCRDKGIGSLSGLEAFPYLRTIDVSSNPLTDIGSLAYLADLVSLKANNTQVDNLAPLLMLKHVERIQVENSGAIPCWQMDYFETNRDLRFYKWPASCSSEADEADFDGDGVTNRAELIAGSSPLIHNDEPSVFEFKFIEHAIFENEETLKMTITRNKGQAASTSVRIKTIADTAQAGEDFIPLDAVLDFAANEREKEISIELVNGNEVEMDEIFKLELSDPVNGTLGQATTAVVTIYDAGQLAIRRPSIANPNPPSNPPVGTPPPTVPAQPNNPTGSSSGGGAIGLLILIALLAASLVERRY